MASIRGRGLATDQLKSNYRKEVEVYLEGDDDVGIYKNYWFPHLTGKVKFRRAQDGDIAVSGCGGVEKNVVAKRLAGVKAFGVVDRDAIAINDANLGCETDDASFVMANHSRNPYIYCTIRWELENYLIDASAWEDARVDAKTRGEGRRADDVVADELLAHCDVLIAHAAANVMRHKAGKNKLGDGYGADAKTRADFERLLFADIMKNYTDEEKNTYYEWVRKVEAFDLPHAPTPKRIFAVCRRVHGKALLERFRRTHKIDCDIRFTLARCLSTRAPGEIADKLNSWVPN